MRLWIRVDASAARDPKVAEFSEALGVSVPTAIGHLVMLWGVMAEHTPDGIVEGVGAKALEDWAGWRGKRGRFADAFTSIFTTDGIVSGWADRQGRLIERMKKDRERKRPGNSTETPRNSAPTVRNGTEPNGKTPTPSAADAAVAGSVRDPESPDRRKETRRRSRSAGSPADEKPERTSWLTPAKEAWESHYGAGSFREKQAAGLLAPLRRAGVDDAEIGRRLREYVRRKRGGYCTIADFAAHHGEYVPVDRGPALLPGGVLSDWAEEETRPPGMKAPQWGMAS